MKIVNIKKVKSQILGAPLFTGKVKSQATLPEKADLSLNFIHFPKGVANKYHTHSNDQVLVVTEGTGFIETKKEKVKLKKGDVVWAPKGEEHRHGATKGSNFTHIAITRSGTKLTQTEE